MLARCGNVGRLVRAAVATSRVGRAQGSAFAVWDSTRDVRVFGARATFASSAFPESPDGNAYSVVIFDYVSDVLERRGPFRAEHLGNAKKMEEQGKIVMAGAFAEPVDGGLFIFKNVTKEEIDDYVKGDPYYKNGLIADYKVKAWTVVVP